MKKYLLTAGFALLVPAVMAMEEDLGDATISTTSSREEQPLPSKIDPQTVIHTFTQNAQNFEEKGGILGGLFAEKALKIEAVEALFAKFSQNYNILLDQLAIANEGLKNVHTVERALKEAQENLDREMEAKRALEERLRATEVRAEYLKSKEENLLLEVDKKDTTILLDQARKRFLEDENRQLKKIISDLSLNASEVERLLRENDDYEGSLPTLEGGEAQTEETRDIIRKIMAENKIKILGLQEKNKTLEEIKKKTEEKIVKLEKAIEANDYYAQILKMIKDQSTSDEDLALFIFSVKRVQGMDLDVLSEGREKRLIEALIKVSRPYEKRPSGSVTCTYEGRFRTLGNQFTPRGLGWNGTTLNLDECTFQGSRFEKSSAELAAIAKQKLSDHKK